MKFGTHNFEIHITGENPRENTKLRAFVKFKVKDKIQKTKNGSEVKTVKLAVVPMNNKFTEKLKNDQDLYQEFLDEDNEIDLELTGKKVGRTSRLLFSETGKLCYKFKEYEIKKDRQGRIVPCEICGELYCQHRIKKQTTTNIDDDDKPIVYVRPMTMDKIEAIKMWSFDKSYQIRHVDGLTYKFCYELATKLHESGKMVLMAPIEDNKPQKIVIRNGGIPFYGWLEGRIKDDKYALILHRTTLRIVD
jgi:hypothetical protein